MRRHGGPRANEPPHDHESPNNPESSGPVASDSDAALDEDTLKELDRIQILPKTLRRAALQSMVQSVRANFLTPPPKNISAERERGPVGHAQSGIFAPSIIGSSSPSGPSSCSPSPPSFAFPLQLEENPQAGASLQQAPLAKPVKPKNIWVLHAQSLCLLYLSSCISLVSSSLS